MFTYIYLHPLDFYKVNFTYQGYKVDLTEVTGKPYTPGVNFWPQDQMRSIGFDYYWTSLTEDDEKSRSSELQSSWLKWLPMTYGLLRHVECL